MADSGRQSFTDKAEANLKPESQKSLGESISDSVKSNMDSLASTVQPNSSKSTTQRVGDTVSGNSNENNQSLFDKAKDAVGMGGNTTTSK